MTNGAADPLRSTVGLSVGEWVGAIAIQQRSSQPAVFRTPTPKAECNALRSVTINHLPTQQRAASPAKRRSTWATLAHTTQPYATPNVAAERRSRTSRRTSQPNVTAKISSLRRERRQLHHWPFRGADCGHTLRAPSHIRLDGLRAFAIEKDGLTGGPGIR